MQGMKLHREQTLVSTSLTVKLSGMASLEVPGRLGEDFIDGLGVHARLRRGQVSAFGFHRKPLEGAALEKRIIRERTTSGSISTS